MSRAKHPNLIYLAPLSAVVLLVAGAVFGLPVWQEYSRSRQDIATLLRERSSHENDGPFLEHLGKRLNAEQRFAESLPLLERAVGISPKKATLRDEWAKAQMGTGHVTEAYGQLREFSHAAPDAPEPPFLLGKFFVTQSSFTQARQELEKAVKRDPKNGEAWSLLAHCRVKMGDYGGAIDGLKKAVVLRPNSPEDHLQLGVLYAAQHSEEAEQEYSLAVAQAPENGVIHREYSRYLLSRGKADAAEKEARRAVERDKDDPFAQLLLGRCLLELRRPQEALPPLLAAAALVPSDPNPAESLRRAYRQVRDSANSDLWDKRFATLRDNAEASRKWEQATLARPGDRHAHEMYASYLGKTGDVNGCARQYSLAYRTTPDNPRVLLATARALNDGGFAAEALPLARRARPGTKMNPEAFATMGDILVNLGRLHEAAINYDRIRDWHADRMPMYMQKIASMAAKLAKSQAPAEVAFRNAGVAPDTATVERLLNEALKADPNHTRALRELLRLQLGTGNKTAAAGSAKRLIALSPEDGLGHTVFALLFLEETKDRSLTEAEANAVRDHLRLAEADSSVAGTLYYTRGLLALRRGQHQQAVADLDRAQKLDPEAVAVYPRLAEARKAAGDPTGAERALAEFRRRTAHQ